MAQHSVPTLAKDLLMELQFDGYEIDGDEIVTAFKRMDQLNIIKCLDKVRTELLNDIGEILIGRVQPSVLPVQVLVHQPDLEIILVEASALNCGDTALLLKVNLAPSSCVSHAHLGIEGADLIL